MDVKTTLCKKPLLEKLQLQLTRAECKWHNELEQDNPNELHAEYFHGVSRGIKAAIELLENFSSND